MPSSLRSIPAASALAALVACSSASGPSSPPPPSTTLATLPPTPAPTPTPDPLVAACGSPAPPPLYGVKIKVQTDQGVRKLLDSRPVVANEDGYCGKVGLPGGARFCDTRPEGHLQREACDALVMGRADDTKRIGPTWTFDDRGCGYMDANNWGCVNHDNNQFLVVARGRGFVVACAADDRPAVNPEARCGGCSIDPALSVCQ
jgi:hypothetical protein